MEKLEKLKEIHEGKVIILTNPHIEFNLPVDEYFCQLRNEADAISKEIFSVMVRKNTVIQVNLFNKEGYVILTLYHFDLNRLLDLAIGYVVRDKEYREKKWDTQVILL